MDALAGLTFREPQLLALLALTPLLALLFVMRERRRRTLAARLISERLRGGAAPTSAWRPWLLAVGFAIAVVAIAGPRLGFETREVVTAQTNLAILLDVSNSMAAPDAGTTRLSAAKAVAKELLRMSDGKVALVAFEGTAEVISPLTSDTGAIADLIDTLGEGELAEPGSNLGVAIEKGLQLLARAGDQRGRIVILSDGEDDGGAVDDAVRKARDAGVSIATVTFGSSSGSEIPTPEGPLLDREGRVVRSTPDPAAMARIARATGGAATLNPSDARTLDALGAGLQLRGTDSAEQVRAPVERYQWPLGAALVLFALASLAHRGGE
jgi:Ca-activated chloride channel family protein